jgi:glycosyltransferase involved in cell wall biosynthesis
MAANLRILQVLPYYYPAHRYGGPIQVVRGLGRELVDLGVDVTVFTTVRDGPRDLDVPIEREVNVDGLKVHYFPLDFPRSYVRSSACAAALGRRAKEFDLVHIHGIYLHPTAAASRMCRRQGVPYVISPHGMLDPYAINAKNRWKKRLYLALVERKDLEHAAALHFTTAEEQRLAASLGIPFRSFVVPLGLDLAEFTGADTLSGADWQEDDARGATVLFLSRIDPKKGLDLLIPAIARVAAARPATRLIIAGPDNNGYLRQVQRLVAQHRLQDRVTYPGMLLGDEKLRALRRADVFVLPSYSENFGIVVLEAMACSKPVVITNRVNIFREVVNSGSGLATPCDPEAIAKAILFVLDSPEQAREMGRRGRSLVEETFTWSSAAQRMLEQYARLVNPAPSS